jgi:hypothetical protein
MLIDDFEPRKPNEANKMFDLNCLRIATHPIVNRETNMSKSQAKPQNQQQTCQTESSNTAQLSSSPNQNHKSSKINSDLSLLVNNLSPMKSLNDITIELVLPKEVKAKQALNLNEAFFKSTQTQSIMSHEEVSKAQNKDMTCANITSYDTTDIDTSKNMKLCTQLNDNLPSIDCSEITESISNRRDRVSNEIVAGASSNSLSTDEDAEDAIDENEEKLRAKVSNRVNQVVGNQLDSEDKERFVQHDSIKPLKNHLEEPNIHDNSEEILSEHIINATTATTDIFKSKTTPPIGSSVDMVIATQIDNRLLTKLITDRRDSTRSSTTSSVAGDSAFMDTSFMLKRKRKLMQKFDKTSNEFKQQMYDMNSSHDTASSNSAELSRSSSSSSLSSITSTSISEMHSKSLLFAPKNYYNYKEKLFKMKSQSEKKPNSFMSKQTASGSKAKDIFSPRLKPTRNIAKADTTNSPFKSGITIDSAAKKLVPNEQNNAIRLNSDVIDRFVNIDKNDSLSIHKRRKRLLFNPNNYNVENAFGSHETTATTTSSNQTSDYKQIENKNESKTNQSVNTFASSEKSIPRGQAPNKANSTSMFNYSNTSSLVSSSII